MTSAFQCGILFGYTLNYTFQENLISDFFLRSHDPWALVHAVFPMYTFITFLPLFCYFAAILRVAFRILETDKILRSNNFVTALETCRKISFIILWDAAFLFYMVLYLGWDGFVEPAIAAGSVQITNDFPTLLNNTDIVSTAITGVWFGEQWVGISSDVISNVISGLIFPLCILYINKISIYVTLTPREIVKRILFYIPVFVLQCVPMLNISLNSCDSSFPSSGKYNTIQIGIIIYMIIMCMCYFFLYKIWNRPHFKSLYWYASLYTIFMCLLTFCQFWGILVLIYIGYGGTLCFLFGQFIFKTCVRRDDATSTDAKEEAEEREEAFQNEAFKSFRDTFITNEIK